VVLFPEATLPLRVIQPNFVAAVEKALTQADAPYTIGVVCELFRCFHLLSFLTSRLHEAGMTLELLFRSVFLGILEMGG